MWVRRESIPNRGHTAARVWDISAWAALGAAGNLTLSGKETTENIEGGGWMDRRSPTETLDFTLQARELPLPLLWSPGWAAYS